MKRSKTALYKSFGEFLNRKDKNINGVSLVFAEKNPNYQKENESNVGCWNCSLCDNCDNCYKCKRCINSNKCNDCENSIHLDHCMSCKCCYKCRFCKNIENGSTLFYK